MARAADIPGLVPDMTFREAAARTVHVRAHELLEASGGVLDTDEIENVHQMRVATRRLRAVLEIYAACFPADLHAAVLKDVKRLADALGGRRDPDVQLKAIDDFARAASPAQQPGLALFRARIAERQAGANEALAAELREVEEHDLRSGLAALVKAAA